MIVYNGKKYECISEKNGKYRVRKIEKGIVVIKEKLFSTKKDAINYFEIETLKLERLKETKQEELINQKFSFLECYEKFERTVNAKDLTKEKNRRIYEKWIIRDWPNMNAVNNDDILKIYQNIRKAAEIDKAISLNYANRLMSRCDTFIEFMRQRGYVQSFVEAVGVRMKFRVPKNSTSLQTIEDNLDTEKFLLLRSKIEEMDDKEIPSRKISKKDLLFAMNFLAFTGCRMSEARAVKFSDIKKTSTNGQEYFVFDVVKVFEDNTAKLVEVTKTQEDRRVLVSFELYDLIKERVKSDEVAKKHYLFSTNYKYGNFSNDPENPISRKVFNATLQKTIKILKKKGDLPEWFTEHLTTRAFRSFFENFYTGKVSEKTLSAVQGHSTEIAKKHYKKAQQDDVLVIVHQSLDITDDVLTRSFEIIRREIEKYDPEKQKILKEKLLEYLK